jgi:HAD superfamily hydrolase (TIGR01509 family)
MVEAVILDIDGTLVDTNYQHVIAWDRAFAGQGASVELWQIHRHMGMGGDQLVAEVAGDEVDKKWGDEIRAAESDLYGELIDEVRVIDGAREMIAALEDREITVVLASSAKEGEVERYVEMLDASDQAAWTTSSDVGATKPAPDLVEAAFAKAGTKDAVMVGDTVWDVKAAQRAGIPAIGVLTGGISETELSEAGAVAVYESVMTLADDLDTALSR